MKLCQKSALIIQRLNVSLHSENIHRYESKVKRLLRKRKRADGNYGSLFSVIHYETFNL